MESSRIKQKLDEVEDKLDLVLASQRIMERLERIETKCDLILDHSDGMTRSEARRVAAKINAACDTLRGANQEPPNQ